MVIPPEVAQLQEVLDQRDSELSAKIADIEIALGRTFRVRIAYAIDERTQLAFGKYDGRWGLYTEDLVDGKITPLLSCPRHERVLAVGWIGKLIAESANQLQRHVVARDKAIAAAAAILADLETKGPV